MKYKISVSRNRIISLLFVLSFLLSDYNSGIPGVDLGELILVFLSAYSIIEFRFRGEYISSRLFAFYMLSLVLSFLPLILFEFSFVVASPVGVLTRWIRYGAHILFLVFCQGCLDKESTVKIYLTVSLVLASYMILQFVAYYAFRWILPIKILPFFSWDRMWVSDELRQYFSAGYFRSFGLMAEPGYSVTFLLPSLALILWDENDRHRLKKLAIMGLGLITSISLQGIVVGVITLLFRIITYKKVFDGKVKRSILALAIAIIAICIWFINSRFSAPVFNRLNSISSIFANGGSGSTAMRLFRGFSVYSQLPPTAKILGIGMGNIGNAVQTFGIKTVYDQEIMTNVAFEYANGLSSILISSGIVGGISFVVVMLDIWKRVKGVAKAIILQYGLLMLAGIGLFNLEIALYFGLAVVLSRTSVRDKRVIMGGIKHGILQDT